MEKFQALGQDQSIGQLAHELQGVKGVDLRFAAGQLFQPLGKGNAVDVGLGHIGPTVGRLADVVDGRDVGVAKLGNGAGAVNKAPGKGVVLRQAGAHNVQTHQTIVIDIIGPVQLSVALLGEALFYLILI